MLHLAPVDGTVIGRAKDSFAVNVSALDAIHVATAESGGLGAENAALSPALRISPIS